MKLYIKTDKKNGFYVNAPKMKSKIGKEAVISLYHSIYWKTCHGLFSNR